MLWSALCWKVDAPQHVGVLDATQKTLKPRWDICVEITMTIEANDTAFDNINAT